MAEDKLVRLDTLLYNALSLLIEQIGEPSKSMNYDDLKGYYMSEIGLTAQEFDNFVSGSPILEGVEC